MKIKLTPGEGISAERTRIAGVPCLVLTPSGRPKANAAVIWIHGGGYILGMKEMVYMSRAADLARRFGVTVISPGCRLAWLHPYPAALDDCVAVLRAVDAERERYGAMHIAVGGESAGGGLATAVCMAARGAGIKVDLQMPLYPMISDRDTESSRDNRGRIWNTRRNHLAWRVYLRRLKGRDIPPYAAPLRQTDFFGLPPCVTFVGDGEPFLCETKEYVRRLREAGVRAEIMIYRTNVHAFDMLYPDEETSVSAKKWFEERFADMAEGWLGAPADGGEDAFAGAVDNLLK